MSTHLLWRVITVTELDSPSVRERLWFLLFAVVLYPSNVWAQNQPTLSGQWSASAMHVQWNIGQWGAACGPRPSGGGSGAGQVTVSQSGSELSISGVGRTWSTTECWEQYPGLARRSHSAGTRGWRNVCKTSDSDPRQATVVTTLSATDDMMSFDETGQYQFVIKGQNCTASVRRTRSLRLVQRQGEAPKTQEKPPTSTELPAGIEPTGASPPKATGGPCATPGPPARLEVRPARKLMRAGETFTFRSSVLDQKGCTLAKRPVWEIAAGSEAASLSANGTISVKPDAKDAEVKLSVSVGAESVEVVIEVVSRDRYEALLAQRGFNEAGESKEAAATTLVSGSIGSKSVVSQGGSDQRITLVAVSGALALAVGVLGLFVVQRRRRQDRARAELALYSVPPATGLPKRCPTCGRDFFGDEQFCTEDATRLVGGSVPPAASSAPPPPTTKICPICGSQYPGVTEFCGKDGATLVPVN